AAEDSGDSGDSNDSAFEPLQIVERRERRRRKRTDWDNIFYWSRLGALMLVLGVGAVLLLRLVFFPAPKKQVDEREEVRRRPGGPRGPGQPRGPGHPQQPPGPKRLNLNGLGPLATLQGHT